MKILVGSKNPVKIDSVREAFSKFYQDIEVEGMSEESGVPDMPYGDETLIGARNRAFGLKEKYDADFYVGIEGGRVLMNGVEYCTGAMHIIDKQGREGHGVCPMFLLPPQVHSKLDEGLELGDVTDEITGEFNTKQNGGVIGFLSKGTMNRKELYVPGLIAALIPFVNEELYFS